MAGWLPLLLGELNPREPYLLDKLRSPTERCLGEGGHRHLARRLITVSGLQCLPPLRSAGAARQDHASAPPRLRCIAPRIAAGADTLTAGRWPVRRRPAGLLPGVTAVPASEAVQLASWMLSRLFRRYD